MSKPKYVNFLENLVNVVNSLDKVDVKLTIGDSINNNRTLTVTQVIRYLSCAGNRRDLRLGVSLQYVFELLKYDIKNSRLNYRTDAIDINEFINFYTDSVMTLGAYRDIIGRTVAA